MVDGDVGALGGENFTINRELLEHLLPQSDLDEFTQVTRLLQLIYGDRLDLCFFFYEHALMIVVQTTIM